MKAVPSLFILRKNAVDWLSPKGAIRAPVLFVVAMLCLVLSIDLKGNEISPTELLDLSLEDLMQIKVSSVAKKPQQLSEAAAAIYVITQEDIHRSGVTSIAEALRMVPGLQVAHIDANNWAITARGFNGYLANKLLVLMDGRSIYSPLFSGVYWARQDTFLEDIDRIEVIRGPGASLWGANAVNGVINIITKSAVKTQGTVIAGGVGTEEGAFGSVRYGGKINEDTGYRLYTKYFYRDDGVDSSGNDTADEWNVLRAGFRADHLKSDGYQLTVQGDLYGGRLGSEMDMISISDPYIYGVKDTIDIMGANLLTRWERNPSATSHMSLQLYYDREVNHMAAGKATIDTVDVDFQHRFKVTNHQELTWGLGYRYVHDDIGNSFKITFSPDSIQLNLFNGFFQDEISFLNEQLNFTLGAKFEHNDFTGFEIQPSARALWRLSDKSSLWSAVSRAVRTPSRADTDIRVNAVVLPPESLPFPSDYPMVISIFGNKDLDSEEIIAYEIGFRTRFTPALFLDIATYYNEYDNLQTMQSSGFTFISSTSPEYYQNISQYENGIHGKTYGVELHAEYRVLDQWRLDAVYTYLEMELTHDFEVDETLRLFEGVENDSPKHAFSIRSMLDITPFLTFDLWFRYTDELPNQLVDSYVSLDARIGWKPSDQLEISLIGQNLASDSHIEFIDAFANIHHSEIERSVYGKISWRF